MEQNPQQSPQSFTSEDEEATYCLSLLRDGDRHQKIVARERLSQIFERRGLLDESAQCLESNIREGVRDPRVYQRLAGVYRRQGRHELADEVLLEARRLAERMARSQPPGARRPGPMRPGRPAPAVPPTALDAPTSTLPASSQQPQSFAQEPAATAAPTPPPVYASPPGGDFDLDPVTVGLEPGGVGTPAGFTAASVAPQRVQTNRPWWASPAVLVLLVLLCGPYGLAIMWVQGGFARQTNVRVTAIWALLMVVLLGGTAVSLQSQLVPMLASAGGLRNLPVPGAQPAPIVFGTPQPPVVPPRPTLPAGLAPSPPSISVSPGALAPRPGGTTIGPGPTPGPSANATPEGDDNDNDGDAAPATPTPASKPQGERVKVGDTGGGGANLRERPGQTGPVIKTVPEGTVLRVVGADQPMDGKGWRNVRDDGGAQGWMAAEFLQPAP